MVAKEDKVEDAAKSSLVITSTIYTKGDAGAWEKHDPDADEDVILGEEVKITFDSSASILPIHIQSCTAQNAKTGATKTLDLVSTDCFQTGTLALATINPQEGATACTDVCSTELLFNQFAFVSGAAANPTLIFHLECDIAVGEADCQSRKRRDTPEFEKVSFDYSVTADYGDFEVDELEDGIVVALENAESSTCAITTGLAGLAFLMV